MTISQALKRGLLVLRRQVSEERKTSPWTLYERLDLGPGGYSPTPARDAKRGVRESLSRKHRR